MKVTLQSQKDVKLVLSFTWKKLESMIQTGFRSEIKSIFEKQYFGNIDRILTKLENGWSSGCFGPDYDDDYGYWTPTVGEVVYRTNAIMVCRHLLVDQNLKQ